MFYAELTREQLLTLLPKGGKLCEVGVFSGQFSRKILDIVAPEELHLVDLWRWTYCDWHNPPATEVENLKGYVAWAKSLFPQYDGGHPDALLEGFYQDLARLAREETRARIKLHRGDSRQMAAAMPAGYFDAIYIDADHHYDSVLGDLVVYAEKLKPDGILFGDDFLEDLRRKDGLFGTIYAVTTFIKRSDFRCILITGFGEAQFVLCRRISPYVEAFLANCINSGRVLVELNEAALPHFVQKTVTIGGAARNMPSFA